MLIRQLSFCLNALGFPIVLPDKSMVVLFWIFTPKSGHVRNILVSFLYLQNKDDSWTAMVSGTYFHGVELLKTNGWVLVGHTSRLICHGHN